MFSVRIVTTDHYIAPPLRGLDVCYSDFRSSEAKKVPVFRIFGASPAGQKTCMHIHGVFPYLYVLYDGTQPWDRYLHQFAASLDKAINIALGSEHSKAQHIYKVTLVSGIPMYGFHEKEEQFLKIYLYNPNLVRRVADLLLGGAVMNKVFQPHESHIPYQLQLFIDYNLYGMNMISVAAVKFRQRKKDDNGNPSKSFEDKEEARSAPDTPILPDNSFLGTSGFITPTLKRWYSENIPSELMLGPDITRHSTCELEVDVVAADILNRLEVDANVGTNPGLAALWEDERQRKRDRGDNSQITPPASQDRGDVEVAESQHLLKKRLDEILLELQPYMDSQPDASSQSEASQEEEDTPDVPLSQPTPASSMELHLSQFEVSDSQGSSQGTVIFEEGEENRPSQCPIVNRDSIHRVIASSQSFVYASQAHLDNSQDQSLVNILAVLADDRSPESSQAAAASQVSALEEQDSVLSGMSCPGDGQAEGQDQEALEMSQPVWGLDGEEAERSGDGVPQGSSFIGSLPGYDMEGMDDTWTESQFLEEDKIPQFDGSTDEKPADPAPLGKRLGTRGPVVSHTTSSTSDNQGLPSPYHAYNSAPRGSPTYSSSMQMTSPMYPGHQGGYNSQMWNQNTELYPNPQTTSHSTTSVRMSESRNSWDSLSPQSPHSQHSQYSWPVSHLGSPHHHQSGGRPHHSGLESHNQGVRSHNQEGGSHLQGEGSHNQGSYNVGQSYGSYHSSGYHQHQGNTENSGHRGQHLSQSSVFPYPQPENYYKHSYYHNNGAIQSPTRVNVDMRPIQCSPPSHTSRSPVSSPGSSHGINVASPQPSSEALFSSQQKFGSMGLDHMHSPPVQSQQQPSSYCVQGLSESAPRSSGSYHEDLSVSPMSPTIHHQRVPMLSSHSLHSNQAQQQSQQSWKDRRYSDPMTSLDSPPSMHSSVTNQGFGFHHQGSNHGCSAATNPSPSGAHSSSIISALLNKPSPSSAMTIGAGSGRMSMQCTGNVSHLPRNDSQEDLFTDTSSVKSGPLSTSSRSSMGSRSSAAGTEDLLAFTDDHRICSPEYSWQPPQSPGRYQPMNSSPIANLATFVSKVSENTRGFNFTQPRDADTQGMWPATSTVSRKNKLSLKRPKHPQLQTQQHFQQDQPPAYPGFEYWVPDRNFENASDKLSNYRRSLSVDAKFHTLPPYFPVNLGASASPPKPAGRGKAGKMKKLGLSLQRHHSTSAVPDSVSSHQSSYSYTFHVPTPVYKRLKLLQKSTAHLLNDVAVVRMHPMDARRYSLLKIGRELVKVKQLTARDIAKINFALKTTVISETRTTLISEPRTTINSEPRSAISSEPRTTMCSELRTTIDSEVGRPVTAPSTVATVLPIIVQRITGINLNQCRKPGKKGKMRKLKKAKIATAKKGIITEPLKKMPGVWMPIESRKAKKSKRKSETELLLEITGPDGTTCVTRGCKRKEDPEPNCQRDPAAIDSCKAHKVAEDYPKKTPFEADQAKINPETSKEQAAAEGTEQQQGVVMSTADSIIDRCKNVSTQPNIITASASTGTIRGREMNTDTVKTGVLKTVGGKSVVGESAPLSRHDLHNIKIHDQWEKHTVLSEDTAKTDFTSLKTIRKNRNIFGAVSMELSEELTQKKMDLPLRKADSCLLDDVNGEKPVLSDSQGSESHNQKVTCDAQHSAKSLKPFVVTTINSPPSFTTWQQRNAPSDAKTLHKELVEEVILDHQQRVPNFESASNNVLSSSSSSSDIGTLNNIYPPSTYSQSGTTRKYSHGANLDRDIPQQSNLKGKRNQRPQCGNPEKYPTLAVYGGNLPPSMEMYAGVEPISSDEDEDIEEKSQNVSLSKVGMLQEELTIVVRSPSQETISPLLPDKSHLGKGGFPLVPNVSSAVKADSSHFDSMLSQRNSKSPVVVLDPDQDEKESIILKDVNLTTASYKGGSLTPIQSTTPVRGRSPIRFESQETGRICEPFPHKLEDFVRKGLMGYIETCSQPDQTSFTSLLPEEIGEQKEVLEKDKKKSELATFDFETAPHSQCVVESNPVCAGQPGEHPKGTAKSQMNCSPDDMEICTKSDEPNFTKLLLDESGLQAEILETHLEKFEVKKSGFELLQRSEESCSDSTIEGIDVHAEINVESQCINKDLPTTCKEPDIQNQNDFWDNEFIVGQQPFNLAQHKSKRRPRKRKSEFFIELMARRSKRSSANYKPDAFAHLLEYDVDSSITSDTDSDPVPKALCTPSRQRRRKEKPRYKEQIEGVHYIVIGKFKGCRSMVVDLGNWDIPNNSVDFSEFMEIRNTCKDCSVNHHSLRNDIASRTENYDYLNRNCSSSASSDGMIVDSSEGLAISEKCQSAPSSLSHTTTGSNSNSTSNSDSNIESDTKGESSESFLDRRRRKARKKALTRNQRLGVAFLTTRPKRKKSFGPAGGKNLMSSLSLLHQATLASLTDTVAYSDYTDDHKMKYEDVMYKLAVVSPPTSDKGDDSPPQPLSPETDITQPDFSTKDDEKYVSATVSSITENVREKPASEKPYSAKLKPLLLTQTSVDSLYETPQSSVETPKSVDLAKSPTITNALSAPSSSFQKCEAIQTPNLEIPSYLTESVEVNDYSVQSSNNSGLLHDSKSIPKCSSYKLGDDPNSSIDCAVIPESDSSNSSVTSDSGPQETMDIKTEKDKDVKLQEVKEFEDELAKKARLKKEGFVKMLAFSQNIETMFNHQPPENKSLLLGNNQSISSCMKVATAEAETSQPNIVAMKRPPAPKDIFDGPQTEGSNDRCSKSLQSDSRTKYLSKEPVKYLETGLSAKDLYRSVHNNSNNVDNHSFASPQYRPEDCNHSQASMLSNSVNYLLKEASHFFPRKGLDTLSVINRDQGMVLTPVSSPPSVEQVLSTAALYHLDVSKAREAYCSNPADVPDRPRELGGRVLKLACNMVKNYEEVSSKFSEGGLNNWRAIIAEEEPLLSSQSVGADLEERLKTEPELRCAVLGDRLKIVTPCKPPPCNQTVKPWLKEKCQKKSAKNKTNLDKNVNDQDKITSKEKTIQLESSNVQSNLRVSCSPVQVEKDKHLELIITCPERNPRITFPARNPRVTSPDTNLFPRLKTPAPVRVVHWKTTISKNTTPSEVTKSEKKLLSPRSERLNHRKCRWDQHIQVPSGTPAKRIRFNSGDSSTSPLHSTPVSREDSSDLFRLSCTPIKSSQDTELKKMAAPRQCPPKHRLSTNTEQSLRSLLASQTWQQQTFNSSKKDTSQIDGPTPKNSFGFRFSQNNMPDSKALHEVQHLTVLSVELHVETRGDRKPDPEVDAIRAMFYSIQNDIPPEHGPREVTGVIIVDELSASHVCSLGSKSPSSTILQQPETSSLQPSTSRHGPSTTSPQAKPSTSSTPSSSLQPSTSRPDPPSATLTPPVRAGVKELLLHRSGVSGLDVQYVPDEQSLLKACVQLVHRWEPDILVGYEIQMLSLGYLLQRASHLGFDICALMSRIPEAKKDNQFSAEKDDWGADHMSEIHIAGRIVLNLWRILRHEVTLNLYSFENVAFHVLHQRLPQYSHRSLTNWFNHKTDIFRWRVIDYYVTRAKGNLELMEQLNLIGRTSEFARVFGIEFFHVLSRGSQYRVESMMLRLAKPLNYIPASPGVQQRARMKAPECIPLTLEPESRFYTHPVVVVDFQSLYPSIMIAYNYCFTTCLGRLENLAKAQDGAIEFGCTSLNVKPSLLKKIVDDVTISPNGVVFAKQHIRKGVISSMVEEILNTRIMVKKEMKGNKNDKGLYRLLDARQMGLKLIANVTYGYTGANFSGRMPCVEVGDSIVRKARETLERAIKLVEETPHWGARVVYGDTDSMFILLKGRSKDEAFTIGQEIADAVTAINPKPIELKFEKVYLPCVLQTKKRYFGYMYETSDQKEPVFDAKGVETVRRDNCPAVSKMLEKAIKILFTTRDVSQIKQYVLRQCVKLLQGRVSLQDCIFAKEYRGMSGYKPGACVPALEIAKKLLRQDRRAEPRVGERVPYVIVYGSPSLPLIQLVRQPTELLNDPSLRLNTTYYITKQILPPLDRFLALLGVNVFTWYQEMPRIVKITPASAFTGESKKGTISQYFSVTNCPVCDEQSKQPICGKCQHDPQMVISTLNERMRQWERSRQHLLQVCYSCMGVQESRPSCASLDCPILYRLSRATQDTSRTEHLRDLLDSVF